MSRRYKMQNDDGPAGRGQKLKMVIHVTLESHGMLAQIIIKHIFQHCLDTSLDNLPIISPVCRGHLMKMLITLEQRGTF